MAKGRKRKDSAGEDVEAYKHKAETRKNAIPAGIALDDTSKPKPKRYDYDPHLDLQLIWSGKKEYLSFQVPTVSLHIHERIAPEAIVRSIKREDSQVDLFAKPETLLKELVEFYQHYRNNYEC
jgi:adenine-specific DNA-methyltransferase